MASAGQWQNVGIQLVAVGQGQSGQPESVDFGPGVESTSGPFAIGKYWSLDALYEASALWELH